MTGYQSKKAMAQDKLAQPEQEPERKALKLALEAYLRLQAQQDALEQLRGDLKDAMQLVRASTLTVDD
jgi:hypothetical protein